jgi:hypothetical protein
MNFNKLSILFLLILHISLSHCSLYKSFAPLRLAEWLLHFIGVILMRRHWSFKYFSSLVDKLIHLWIHGFWDRVLHSERFSERFFCILWENLNCKRNVIYSSLSEDKRNSLCFLTDKVLNLSQQSVVTAG